MGDNRWRALAGLLIIIIGVLLLLIQWGRIDLSRALIRSLVLLVAAAPFCLLWLSNPKEWWPLIPGCILLSWGIANLLDVTRVEEWLVVAVGFAGTVAPFVYIFAKEGRKDGWWALIPAGIVASWGLGTVLSAAGSPGTTLLLVGFLGSALTFLLVWSLNPRENWWALIPGGVMALLGIVTTLSRTVGEEWFVAFLLWGIALVFAGVFVSNRGNWWALVPASVLALVGAGLSPASGALWAVLGGILVLLGLSLVVRVVVRRG